MTGQTTGGDATTLPRQLQVPVELDALRNNIEKLAHNLAELESRMEPVMSNAVPALATKSDGCDQGDLCGAADTLARQNGRIEQLIHLSSDLLFRLEI